MLNISVTGENNEKGRHELRRFDKLLNKEFIIMQKISVKFTEICHYKSKYLNNNKTAIDRVLNGSNILQTDEPTGLALPILGNSQVEQSTLIHPANQFQGVNLIYAVDTN